MALEHDINLAIGPTLHLRQPDICHHQANKASAAPDVAALAAEISTLYYVSNFHLKASMREESYRRVEHIA